MNLSPFHLSSDESYIDQEGNLIDLTMPSPFQSPPPQRDPEPQREPQRDPEADRAHDPHSRKRGRQSGAFTIQTQMVRFTDTDDLPAFVHDIRAIVATGSNGSVRTFYEERDIMGKIPYRIRKKQTARQLDSSMPGLIHSLRENGILGKTGHWLHLVPADALFQQPDPR